MRLSIYCERCECEVSAFDGDDARALEAVLVACHSQHPSPHRLTVRMAGAAPPAGPHLLELRCVLPECGHEPRRVSVKTPMELVGMHTISFHTHHEGHAIEIKIDGAVVHPQG